jgi:hypothetical protein
MQTNTPRDLWHKKRRQYIIDSGAGDMVREILLRVQSRHWLGVGKGVRTWEVTGPGGRGI